MTLTESTTEAPGTGIPTGDTPPNEPVEADTTQEPANGEPGETFTVKVDGNDVEVTLDELRNGYSRQQDYTRKTQELADHRKQLQPYIDFARSLNEDPQGTLKALNEAYKMPSDEGNGWDDMDPQEREIAQIKSELQQLRARDAKSTIDGEFRTLEQKYGELDRQEIANFALRNDLTVTDAYMVMNFDRMRDEHKRLSEEAGVVEQKRNAQLPHGGSSTQKAAVTTATTGQKMSVREAYLAALKQAQG